ncbi:cupin domain-containing protein [Thermoproteota archaeon]
MKSWTHRINIKNPSKDWNYYPISRFYPKNVNEMSVHVSVLKPGKIPHTPHVHSDEELVVILSGKAKIIHKEKRILSEDVKPGSIVFHDSNRPHTIKCIGAKPVVYICVRWGGKKVNKKSLRSKVYNPKSKSSRSDWNIEQIFESKTEMLEKLHCHVSTMKPGAGYKPHRDSHDVLIITMQGIVETLGQKLGPESVIYYQGGEPHGMRNPGKETARYIVFEFHGRPGMFNLYPLLKRAKRYRPSNVLRFLMRKMKEVAGN